MWIVQAIDRGDHRRPRILVAATDGTHDAVFSAYSWGWVVKKLRRLQEQRQIEFYHTPRGSEIGQALPGTVISIGRHLSQTERADWLLLRAVQASDAPDFPPMPSRADPILSALETRAIGPGWDPGDDEVPTAEPSAPETPPPNTDPEIASQSPKPASAGTQDSPELAAANEAD